jgi:hypothetical protein
VYDLKISPLLLFFFIASWHGSAMAADHCKPDEITYFSCAIKGSEKIISVCGGTDWLQYRFGKIGAIELEHPKDRVESLSQFRGASRFHGGAGVAATWLMFERKETEYAITQMEGGSNLNGISVSLPDSKKSVNLNCDRRRQTVFKLHDAVTLVPEGDP